MILHIDTNTHIKPLISFSFITREGIIYMTIAERQYNQKLVFVFLQELAHAFHDELRNTYGSANNIDYLSKIETIEKQYSFLKFGKCCWKQEKLCIFPCKKKHMLTLIPVLERVILKKKKEFKDMNKQENIDKLNQELIDVNKIMTESFEMLLNRDNNLR